MKCAARASEVDVKWVAEVLQGRRCADLGGVVNMAGPNGDTALHLALKNIDKIDIGTAKRKAAIAHMLIVAGADPFRENDDGMKPTDYVPPEIAEGLHLPFSTRGATVLEGVTTLWGPGP